MKTLNKHGLKWCLRRLPRPLLQVLKDAGPRLCVAGGFVRSCIADEPINDIDLFVRSKDDGEWFAEKIRNALGRKRVIVSDNAFTVPGKLSIQIIHRWVFKQPRDVVVWWENGEWASLCDPDFWAHP